MKFLLAAVLLASSAKAIQFDCKFSMGSMWTVSGNHYICNATVINSGAPYLQKVTGVHQTGKTNDNVEFLYIIGQYLPFFPDGIAGIFKNLKALWIMSSSLTSISANDLRPFPQLLVVIVNGNKLTSIDGDLFKYTPSLTYVNFNDNQIEHIGNNLVTNLNNLTTLYFGGNICINLMYATVRSQVVDLGTWLTYFCPPLEVTPTNPSANCMCGDVIAEQNRKIEQLKQAILQLNGMTGK